MSPSALSQPDVDASTGLIRVLVADDSAAIRTLARYALSQQRGFDVVAEATNGIEALAAFDSAHPDCVVLDIEMPNMGGFEALAQFHERSPGLPVVMLSGQSDRAAAEQALQHGAASYVDKSGSLVQLAEAVRQATSASSDEGSPLAAEDRTSASTGGGDGASAGLRPARTAKASDTHRQPDDLAAQMRRLEYVVSHDLGEPLRIMTGFAGLLEGRYTDALEGPGRTFLSHIVDAASRMQGMLDDLVAYSRAGRAEPQPVLLDLTVVARQAVDALAEQTKARGAEISIESLPAALADAQMTQTVLRHLVRNAIVFNSSETPLVTIAGRAEGGMAVVTVTDNGIGIGPKDRDAVFELFRRLNAREAYPGTGTGLALCRRLVTKQGGTVSLESAPGAGTKVTVALPAPKGSPIGGE